jgi:hypothetical protein
VGVLIGKAKFDDPPGTEVRAEWGETGLEWVLEGYARSRVADSRRFVDVLNRESRPPFRDYSPADGQPGYVIAADVVKEFGGTWTPAPAHGPVEDELV